MTASRGPVPDKWPGLVFFGPSAPPRGAVFGVGFACGPVPDADAETIGVTMARTPTVTTVRRTTRTTAASDFMIRLPP